MTGCDSIIILGFYYIVVVLQSVLAKHPQIYEWMCHRFTDKFQHCPTERLSEVSTGKASGCFTDSQTNRSA